MATRVFEGIKFREKFFKEDHPRYILAKFGTNWLGGLGGVDVQRNCRRCKTDATPGRFPPSRFAAKLKVRLNYTVELNFYEL